MKECCQPQRGLNPRPPGLQSDAHPSELPRPQQGVSTHFSNFSRKICCGYSLDMPQGPVNTVNFMLSRSVNLPPLFLADTLLMSTHIRCFCGEIRKLSVLWAEKSTLSGALTTYIFVIALDKMLFFFVSIQTYWYFSYFSTKTNIVGTH